MILPLSVHAATHVGLVHETNEDSHAVVPTEEGGLLLLVCDGMGGMGHGDEASALAVQLLSAQLQVGGGYPPQRMRQAVRQADITLREQLCTGERGMPGSTAVLVYVLDGAGHVAWVGDSRAYLVRAGAVVERTSDHKLINELMATGKLSEEEAKGSHLSHIVTRALGGRGPAEKPVTGATLGHPWKLRHGDVIVLCSDGVCDLVEDDEIPPLVSRMEPAEATDALVRVALERGGHDNITCIVARWDGPDFIDDDVATPLMAPREDEEGPLEDPGLHGVIDTLDERLGAERATEEIQREDGPLGVVGFDGSTPMPPRPRERPPRGGDDETEDEEAATPPILEPTPAGASRATPTAADKHPQAATAGARAEPHPSTGFAPSDRSRAWTLVVLSVLVLLAVVLSVLAGA